MTKKGKEKQVFSSQKTLTLQVRDAGQKIDEITVDFFSLPRRFYFITDLFTSQVLSDSHSLAKKRGQRLREINEFLKKHI